MPFARGWMGSRSDLALSNESVCPEKIRSSLSELPNNDQAYSISPIFENNKVSGLLLVGNTPYGLLYAARTLEQLLNKPGVTISVSKR